MSILKVTTKRSFTLTLQNISLAKPQGGGGQIAPPLLAPPSFFRNKGINIFTKITGHT